MTPRYQWTPASEPPDTYRSVVVWYGPTWCEACYQAGFWYDMQGRNFVFAVTHWRDVEPPEAGE